MRVSLLSVIAVLAAAVLPDRGATALRVAFVADTGIGNDNPRADCRGSYGEDMVCDYGPVAFVLSSVGVEEAGEGSDTNRRHYEFLERALSGSDARWKVCVWHMNMEEMQVSYKGDPSHPSASWFPLTARKSIPWLRIVSSTKYLHILGALS